MTIACVGPPKPPDQPLVHAYPARNRAEALEEGGHRNTDGAGDGRHRGTNDASAIAAERVRVRGGVRT